MASTISCPVRTECGMFVMCCMYVSAVFVVRGFTVSKRYIYVCYCDLFSVVNVYLDHLKFLPCATYRCALL